MEVWRYSNRSRSHRRKWQSLDLNPGPRLLACAPWHPTLQFPLDHWTRSHPIFRAGLGAQRASNHRQPGAPPPSWPSTVVSMLNLSWAEHTMVRQGRGEFTMDGGCREDLLLEMGLYLQSLEMFEGMFAWPGAWHLVCLYVGRGGRNAKAPGMQRRTVPPECQEHHWDLGLLRESLNSRYWVGGSSLLKRGQKILMTVDCAHHPIPDLGFGSKIHLHLQGSCKNLHKPK